MIPLRVTMSGWMRYRDRQSADFTGARLLSIAGENGAGKSSIFDAITYALFGRHRLGRQDIDELVSEGLDQCMVEFEFEVNERRYRVRRSRNRRPSPGSQGLWAWDESAEDWVAMAGSARVQGLNAAVNSLVRVTPEAFTSSFLLQQGAATAFLDADPAPRFKVVSSLVNLEAYEAIERKARDAQRSAAAEVAILSKKLADYEGVDAESLELLRERLRQAGEAREAAAAGRDRALGLREVAQTYGRLVLDLATAERHVEAAAELLAEAEEIEANARRFDALGGEIEAVRLINGESESAALADAAAHAARTGLAAIDLDAMVGAVEEAAARAVAAVAEVERQEAAHERAGTDERAAADFAAQAERILALRGRLSEEGERLADAALELDRLPDLEAEVLELRSVAAALPLLQQHGRDRQAVEKLGRGDPKTALAEVAGRVETLSAQRASVIQTASEAADRSREAGRKAAAARARSASVAEQVSRRRAALDEAVCSRCGQRIDPEQARRELDAVEREASDLERGAALATEDATRVDVAEREAVQRRDDHQEALRGAEYERDTLAARVADLDEAQNAARASFEQFVQDAPESLRALIPHDLPMTRLRETYQEWREAARALDGLQVELARLHRRDGERRTAEAQIDRLRGDLETAERQAGDRLANVAGALERRSEAERHLRGTRAALDAARDEERRTNTIEAAAREALAGAEEQRRALDSEMKDAERMAEGHRRTARQLATRLDEAFRGRALADPRAALDLLEREQERLAGAPDRARLLASARQEHSRFEGMAEALRKELEQIPIQQQISVEEAQATVASAESALRESDETRAHCEREVQRMAVDLAAAESMRAELAVVETRSERLKKLVVLLGRGGLQGALVSEALETVTSHANAFLQRLSGGSLRLELERGDGDALDLKAVDATCMREARSVQVLSGSQKFRCAVAIASGIGQYAGAGGMRSIVIDEGFGSLDQEGQHLIIQELKALAEHMDRVIVVSHLDAFADRAHFPDQLRVRRDGEGSKIERVL